jgi:acyl-coenzyme A thioesterase PaaI-like protein
VVERSELAPGWVVDQPILSIGGRSPPDEASAAIMAEVMKKRGLATKALPAEAISAGHIASLANTEAKLVCLSYLGLGAGPALIRYLVRRLRRILPEGTLILVCYWNEEGNKAATKAMLETAEADAYATTLPEAVELCVKAAKGELKREQAEDTASAPDQPSGDKPKPRAPKRKPQSAAA